MRLITTNSLRNFRRPLPRGFTIIEVIVALLVTTIGVLALASTSTLVLRLGSDAAIQILAANTAQSRFELLRSLECGQIADGSHTTGGLTERWQVSPVAPRTWLVAHSVTFLAGRRAPQVYRSLVAC